MKRRALLRVLAIAFALATIAALGAAAFIYSGVYDIAARSPHLKPVRMLLTTVQNRSVRFHARSVVAPELDDPVLVQRGLHHYRELCLPCHGAPGEARQPIGTGMNPTPPPLPQSARLWSDEELYWITANGLKMAGMPAFALGHPQDDLWSIVAFVRTLPRISPSEYRSMVAALDDPRAAAAVRWLPPEGGWERLRRLGDPARGRAAFVRYGCGSCHTATDLRAARGVVGPPLDDFSRRIYIAGNLTNTPDNLVLWIMDPPAIEQNTAMPDLDVSPSDALDIAAFLYRPR